MITLLEPIAKSKSLSTQEFTDKPKPKQDDLQKIKVESMQDFYSHKPRCLTERDLWLNTILLIWLLLRQYNFRRSIADLYY